MIPLRRTLLAALGAAVAACSDPASVPSRSAADAAVRSSLFPRAVARFSDALARQMAFGGVAGSSAWPVLVGAGDIAKCYEGTVPTSLEAARAQALMSPAAATASLLDRIPGTVVALGDNAYETGSPFDYAACYEPTWGRHRERTAPAAGNHEYLTPGAAGYFTYFAERSAPPLGYYSYDVGDWHVIVLNSTPQVYACYPPEGAEVVSDPRWPAPQLDAEPTSATLGRLCAGDVAQQAWLVADLQANANHHCTVAYFHHPRYSSGSHGNHYQMQRVWDILYAHGVDVVLSAHDHNYERFAPQDPDDRRDDAFGIREFVVGTGGGTLRPASERIPNSEVVIDDRYGVLALGLGEGGYGWAFVDTEQAILDSGSDRCHGPPPDARLSRLGLPDLTRP